MQRLSAMETLDESVVTLQFGIVKSVQQGRATVELPDMDGLITDFLPVLVSDSQDNKHFRMPSIGSQVSLLLDSRGERGVILGAIYSDVDQPTSPNNSASHTTYKDGAVIEYDPESSTLKASGIKDAIIDGTGDLNATFDGDINAKSRSIVLESETDIRLQAPNAIYLTTPMTVIAGGITAGGGMGRSLVTNFRATFNIPVDFIAPASFYKVVEFKVSPIIEGTSYDRHTHPTPAGESGAPS